MYIATGFTFYIVKKFGVGKFFLNNNNLLCSLRMKAAFDQKYNKTVILRNIITI